MYIYFTLVVVSIPLCIMLYKRYFPLFGIPYKKIGHGKADIIALDIRDYNVDVNDNQSDMRIPYAYFKRFNQKIPNEKLHVIANDRLELHLGIRYLLSKGFHVASYQINNYSCKGK